MGKTNARETLREMVKVGDTLHTICMSVAKSGMSRVLRVYRITSDGDPHNISFLVAEAVGMPKVPAHDGLRVEGCGTDAGFQVTHCLSYALHGHEPVGVTGGTTGHTPEEQRAYSDAQRNPTPEYYVPGYTLKQRWM